MPKMTGRSVSRPNWKLRILISALLGTALGALSGAVVYFFPLEYSQWTTEISLWTHGVRQIESAGLRAYALDLCGTEAEAEHRECTCVALVHGLGDNALTWKNLLLWPKNHWRSQVSGLKIYAFDLPGSGKSPAPVNTADYEVPHQAEKLKAALEPLCPHWTVVGNSLGGWISSWLALDWPQGVTKLVLVDSAGLKPKAQDVPKMLSSPSVESLKEFQRRAYDHPRKIPERVWEMIAERAKRGNSSEVVRAQKEADYLDARFAEIHVPTLVFWGLSDRLITPDTGERIHSLIPGSIWRTALRCGHLPQKECPAALVGAIGDFLLGHS